ncbi:MAG: HAD family hydrolase [Erysipelotrichaceae bacterium]|nr:HAD family hydrolase [Erysipelotrichaceae bacterium]
MKPVLFFDVDGTLVDTKTGNVPLSTQTVLKRLQKEGYKICLATGRTFENLTHNIVYTMFDWDGYICGNGVEVINGNKDVLQRKHFSPKTVKHVMDVAKNNGHQVMLIHDDGWNMTEQPNENALIALEFLHEPVPPIKPYTDQKILMMLAFADKGHDYREYNEIPEIRSFPSYITYADLVLSFASKAHGMDVYMNHVGATESVAFGDSLNDYEMLQHATVSVAMGQGENRLKEISDVVTKPVDEDGIAYAIDVLQVLQNEKIKGEQ